MALMNSLLASWNFDNLSGSDGLGQLNVSDVSNDYSGTGLGFSASSKDFILKEDIKTNKYVFVDTLESIDTIQIADEDDRRADSLRKPNSLTLLLENSMYQIISEEMMSMFSSINSYAFKYTRPSSLYDDSYALLDSARNEFFSNILDKPNLEKYIEFYKWIDSALGYLLEQLKPENSNTVTGLKNTVESHILERNKVKHRLPLTIGPDRIFSNSKKLSAIKALDGTRTRSISRTQIAYVTGNINNEKYESAVENVTNIQDLNFKNNYEVIQTAGRVINHRNETTSSTAKRNKSIFNTRFSSADWYSDRYKNDQFGEYSVYNNLNERGGEIKRKYNLSQSKTYGFQPIDGINESEYNKYNIQGSNDLNNFRDNNYIQRNIPYLSGSEYSSSYSGYNKETGEYNPSHNYYNIPNSQVEFYKHGNILVDRASFNYNTEDSYAESIDIREPPFRFSIPTYTKFRMNSGTEMLEAWSPYNAAIDNFSYRNKLNYNEILERLFPGINIRLWFDKLPFLNKLYYNPLKNVLTMDYMKNVDIIFPRTDLIGLADSRTKLRYEEEKGVLLKDEFETTIDQKSIDSFYPGIITKNLPWSDNSYNNNSSKIRMFWRDRIEDRQRTRGIDQKIEGNAPTGSFNCYGFPNYPEFFMIPAVVSSVDYKGTIYDSIWSMDSNISPIYSSSGDEITVKIEKETYGDLAPYSHFWQLKEVIQPPDPSSGVWYDIRPKPQFIHNLFLSKYAVYNTGSLGVDNGPHRLEFIFNNSYQNGLDCKIKPFYDTYEEYRENIKHRSQNMSVVQEFIHSNYVGLLLGNDYDVMFTGELSQTRD